MRLDEAVFLEGKVAHAADHEQRRKEGQPERHVRHCAEHELGQMREKQYKGGKGASPRGNGQADKEAFGGRRHAYIEAGQAQRAACGKEKGGRKAESAEMVELPGPGEYTRRHAEGDGIGKRVVFHAELAGRSCQTGRPDRP